MVCNSDFRLHNSFVILEAMSPGESKTDGQGLQIHYGIHDTPFGKSLIATTSRGICNLHFLNLTEQLNAKQILKESWSKAEIIHNQNATQSLCDQIFNPNHEYRQPLTLLVKGTNFQVQVWQALLQIPLGEIATYKAIAEKIERPHATRAVGSAIGKNLIGYLIPCHRIIRSSGALGGYRWGLERKAAILAWEASYRTHLSSSRA